MMVHQLFFQNDLENYIDLDIVLHQPKKNRNTKQLSSERANNENHINLDVMNMIKWSIVNCMIYLCIKFHTSTILSLNELLITTYTCMPSTMLSSMLLSP